MNRRMLGRIATMSLMLGIVTVGCTPTAQMSLPATLAGPPPRATEVASRAADNARAALAGHKGDAAVAAAEKAVSIQPNDAAYRMLLGQSYLTAGRFASAETSFRDSLTLSPDQPKARFDLALAQIALGRSAEAQAVLHSLDGTVPAADLGLALAMAGDHQAGIQMLTDVVRSGKSDVRGRQNLALAFALAGHWGEARAMAMQDTPADKISAQIVGWAELARPDAGGGAQIAAMLGVKPASDPGLPTELALASPAPVLPGVVPVAIASASPVPAAVPAVSRSAPGSITVPLADAIPMTTPADAPAAAVMFAAQRAAKASDLAPVAAPPSLLRAPQPVQSVQLVSPVRASLSHASGYVVQLGAYSRASAIQNAWSRASRLMPKLAGYAPTRAEFSYAGGSLVRLSVSGFSRRADAVRLCENVRTRGGQCFVRTAAGDAPLQWVRKDPGVQFAAG